MKKVLVAGATGYLGQYLVAELKKQGYWVRALVRRQNQQGLVASADHIYVGEVTEPNTLHGVTEGIDVVISAVGITRQKDGLTYMDVDYQGNINLLDEAIADEVKQFVYVSAIDGDKNRHLKIFEAKERFADELKQSSLSSIIVRPNGYFSDMGDFLKMAASGRVYLFGDGHVQINPISGKDLAEFIVKALNQGQARQELSVGGPEVLSLNDIANCAAQALGQDIKISYLPDWVRRGSIFAVRHFTPQKFYGPIEFFLTFMGESHLGEPVGGDRLEDFYRNEVNMLKKSR
ncbi:SDR family oxidoreductase [Providencia rettgeri]|uniref:SDR family oxidoreductase n=2 Tax=Providencia TaxID=586 RepID=A0AA42FDK0_9GAMM|nr:MULTISPECIES: SDR family oxidoreductase [Providencia]MBC8653465.1 SDR family oxidoreductase [Providencia vermicola]APC12099.1 NAD(P)H azoreductase [Providencia rettgeri]AVL75405.1 SDR family NAD(P)-dependent oxidoreductase [Providencia rettgeri]EIL1983821.1 SDR family oxidoreductase [Providencia rettgeri]EIU7556287.1 SDR family oxidoreductase [Providencia rettgeri]